MLCSQHVQGSRNDLFRRWLDVMFERRAEGYWHVKPGDPPRRCLEITPCLLGQRRRQLRCYPTAQRTFIGDDKPASLRDRCDQTLLVQRFEGPWVYDLDGDRALASTSAAVSAFCTMLEVAMMVRSVPARFTSALPNGMEYIASARAS